MHARIRHPLLLAALAAATFDAQAAHPLNTDDTGVQGAGNFQLELTLDDSSDKAGGVRTKVRDFSTTLSYGITETADLILAVPYLRVDSPPAPAESGVGDASLELKWKFYDRNGLSYVIKPGMSFHNGDENKGLGAGKNTYSALFVTTLERDPWSWHFNLGYTRNRNLDPAAIRENLFVISAAFFHQTTDNLKLVADVGVSSNEDRSSDSHPAYVLGGLIYSPTKDLDLDLGIQLGANKVAEDRVLKAGVTFRW